MLPGGEMDVLLSRSLPLSAPMRRSLWLIPIVGVALIIAPLAFEETVDEAMGTDRPNIVLISVDTLRADRLPCYGHSRNTAPNICGLAEEGVVFERAIAQAPWTLASHASLFSGQYPATIGLPTIGPYQLTFALPETITTLGEALNATGYTTAGFVGAMRGKEGVAGGGLRPRFGFDRGFDTYHAEGGLFNTTIPAAQRWVEQNRSEPFFLFLHGMDVHSPYRVPADNTDRYMPNYTGPLTDIWLDPYPDASMDGARTLLDVGYRNGSLFLPSPNGSEPMTDDDLSYVRAAYDGGILHADAQVGRFLDTLRAEDLYEDTVIIVIGDHGEELGEHPAYRPIFGHAFPWSEAVHVPLIVRFPDERTGRVPSPVALLDVMPTILDRADATTPSLRDQMQGRSLLPLVRGTEPNDTGRYVFTGAGKADAVRTDRWTYIAGERGPLLYNSTADTIRNRVHEYPSIAERLRTRLEAWKIRNQRIAAENNVSLDPPPQTE